MFLVNKNPTSQDVRGFGRAMLIGFGVLGVVLWCLPAWRSGEWSNLLLVQGGHRALAVVFLLLGIGLYGLAHAVPAAGRAVYIGWMSLFVPVGIVMSTILLTLLFLVLLPVFVVIVRLGDPLRTRLRPEASTYWEPYRHQAHTLERMRRPF